ncbi:MAG: indole-3-glycerol phosphate synthase TrpC [Actinomycetota bacterium]|nr:indole-3-glycerol phosphate synthase TrpC [Actinomycetota bacterium]
MSYLQSLVSSAEKRVENAKRTVSEGALEQRIVSVAPPHSLRAALDRAGVALIGEIKRASPSAGELDLALNPAELADGYVRGGAAAVSVLTEPDGFRGSLEDLEDATGAGVPVLRKDFVVDPWQALESRAAGADAVLLIARVVGERLPELLSAVEAFGMEALVEVYDDDDLERAAHAGAKLIGVNHRDLATFEVDPARTAKLAPRMPEGATLVALSGVSRRAEVVELEAAGADAVLVGEALVTAEDPAAKVRELLGSS